MLRLALIACALVASASSAARPLVIQQSQTLTPPPGSGYYFFGLEVAIDGDWAIITAATPSPTPSSPNQTHDALLYHYVNGEWSLDRVLIRRQSTSYSDYVGFRAVAMNNGVAVIGANPTRAFKRSGNTWTEISHPFTAPPGALDHVNGDLEWDGNTLLAVQPQCTQQRPWGALISTLSANGSWSPIERLSSGDTNCELDPVNWGISGNTVVAGTYTYDYEVSPDKYFVFRRSGTTWAPALTISSGNGEADVRGDEFFYSSNSGRSTLVYRNDDTQTVVDNLRTVSASYDYGFYTYGYTHTDEVMVQDRDIFQKDAAGKYQHVAALVPEGAFAMVDDAKIDGRRLITQAWGDYTSSNGAVLIFDLPATYTPSDVVATGFANGSSQFTAQLGTFAVATENGNQVYRQSSLTGDYRALVGDNDWTEQAISADIEPTAFSGNDRWFGLAVRYLDASNYYYVTLRSSNVVALKMKRNGVTTTLAQKALPVVAGRSYHVSLKVEATRISVSIDGQPFIYWYDSQPIPHGNAALIGYRTAVDHDNVVAAEVGTRPIFDSQLTNCYGSLNNSPVWSVNGQGSWTCASDTGLNVVQQASLVGDSRAVVGTPTDDQIVTTRARLTGVNGQDRWFGVAARYVDQSNYYFLTVRSSNTVSLRKLVNGVITVLGTVTLPVTPNTWYDLRLDAVGNELRAFVNGTQVLQATDSSHAIGQGGILTYKATAEYANYFSWQP